MKAICVRRDGLGCYTIPGEAEPEDFANVRREADRVERLNDLVGWGDYTAVFRVRDEWLGDRLYFVAEAN